MLQGELHGLYCAGCLEERTPDEFWLPCLEAESYTSFRLLTERATNKALIIVWAMDRFDSIMRQSFGRPVDVGLGRNADVGEVREEVGELPHREPMRSRPCARVGRMVDERKRARPAHVDLALVECDHSFTAH